jgi:predicted dehydrogenase
MTSRRSFITRTASVAGGLIGAPHLLLGQQSKKLNFACVGVGGKGISDMKLTAEGANIVAMCDVDTANLDKAKLLYPDAKAFSNYKEMLSSMGDKVDGVIISTPDHTHYPVAMEAIKQGKHVCVQKPLVNRIWEANQLHLAAQKKGVKTNMGNQGHTGEGIRQLKEWLNAGIVGNVKEIHIWTNRPIWPQGDGAKASYVPAPVPTTLNWTEWLSCVPDMPYVDGIHPFKWRGHREFGAGAMGDMGCHIMDGPFWGCDLGEPYKIEADCDQLTEVTWPQSSKVILYFKTAKWGEIKLHWYEGTRNGVALRPERPAKLEEGRDWAKMKSGFIIYGDEDAIINTDDYCRRPELIGNRDKLVQFSQNTPKTLERSLAPDKPQLELVYAIEQGKTCGSNFDYSVPLTKLCLLGNLGIANPGKVIEWDSATQKTNNDEINKLLTRAAYREGYAYTADNIA